VHSSARATKYILLFVLAVVLFAVGLSLRLPLVPLLDVSTDATDPIVASLKVRDGHGPFFTDTPRFGYGRTLSYVPLTLAPVDGLEGYARRRAVVQSLVAPLVFLAVLLVARGVVLGASAMGAFLAGLLVACDPELLLNYLWGHHGYLGPEWSVLALLGFLWVLTADEHRRSGAVLLGLALALGAMNHPYALSSFAALGLLVRWGSRGRPAPWSLSSPVFLAAAVALVVLLPHGLYLLGLPPGRFEGDVLESLASTTPGPDGGLWSAAVGLFGQVQVAHGCLALAGLSLCLGCSLGRQPGPVERVAGRLGIAVAASVVVLMALASLSRQVHNWHGRHLVPWLACCVGVTLVMSMVRVLDRSRTWDVRWRAGLMSVVLIGGLAVAVRSGVDSYRRPLQEPHDSLLQLATVREVAGMLSPDRAPWGLVGYVQSESQRAEAGSRADLFPVVLDRVVAGEEALLAKDTSSLSSGATLIFAEGDAQWIARVERTLRASQTMGGVGDFQLAPWTRSTSEARALVLLADDRAVAVRLGQQLCGLAGPGNLEMDDPRDGMALLGSPDGSDQRSPGLYPCTP